MARDHSENIDDYCRENYGHSNWGYLDTYTKEELKKADHDIENNIVFWHEDDEEGEEQMKKQDKCTGWAIVATIERSDGTWYDETILDIDDDTASSVDEFLTDYIKEKNEESNEEEKI